MDNFFTMSEQPKYAKIGIYGSAGTGKTRTALEIAIGLIKEKGLKKEICFFDTERGIDWNQNMLSQNGIKCFVKKSRSFVDLLKAGELCVKNEIPILIVDSITHVWRELIEGYVYQLNKERYQKQVDKGVSKDWLKTNFKKITSLEFQDWGKVKPQWQKFNDFYLSSPLNIIVCGRAADDYSYEDDGRGRKQLIKTSTRMATEKELSYEPSLLINMFRETKNDNIEIYALVEKDRSDTINGKIFQFPNYNSFKPHFDLIQCSGDYSQFSDSNSGDLFEGSVIDGQSEIKSMIAKKEGILENIKALLELMVQSPRSDEGKKAKLELMNSTFGTRSMTDIENMSLNVLEEKYFDLKADYEQNNNQNG